MQKKCNSVTLFLGNRINKYLLMTKLSVILSFIFSFQALAGTTDAQKINLQISNVSVESALKAIEAQGDYRFVYETGVLPKDKLVSVSAENASLGYVMSKILNNTLLSYEVINNTLVVIATQDVIKAKIISGKVLSASGSPLPGVSIVEKGTNNGTASREDGSFSLNVNSSGSILVFSSLGYLSKEVQAVENMTVILEKYDAELDQVIIVGYGTQKKGNLTGAVSTVDFDNQSMSTRAVSNVSSALAGLSAGIRVRQDNGLPKDNNDADLNIRGVGSLNISSAPLVLVDGQVASIGSVSPNDVASVSILKDAASAAIYGSRASNGVILITTKTGKGAGGKVTFSYNGYTGTKSPTLLPDYAYNTVDHMKLINMALENSGTAPWYSADDLAEWAAGIKTDPLKYPSTNWFDAITKKNIIYSHNLSARGGSEKINFYTSMDYYKDDGMIYNSGFSRLSFRNNLTYNVNKWLKLGNNISYSSSNAGPLSIDNVFQWLRAASPSIYPQAPDGRFGAAQLPNETGTNNQVARAKVQRGETKGNRLQGKVYGVFSRWPGFQLFCGYIPVIELGWRSAL